jgi:glutathione peroxidase
MTNIADFTVATNDGGKLDLADKQGQVLLIVNTASQCGFTPQYKGLQELHEKYSEQGFEVLGFPSNQFGGQEPGSDEEIAEFCSLNYDVDFPLMVKVEVNGDDAEPLYRWLREEAKGLMGTTSIKWNFTKFLIDRGGAVVRRYPPTVAPAAIAGDIEKLL